MDVICHYYPFQWILCQPFFAFTIDYIEDFEVAEDVIFVRPKKEVISLRLDPKIVRKLRELADEEGLPPTTYARMLIVKGIRESTL